MKASRKNGYGPVQSENERVGTVNAESAEAKADDHGMAAVRKRKRGGKVEGEEPRHRMDRPHRAHGGKVAKKGVTVNVIVAGGGGGAKPPMPMPPPGALPPPGAMPPHPPMAPPPGGMPPPPPGAPPPGMMRKAGGRVGESHKYPDMDAGALSGEGRLEKVDKYGKRAKESEGK